MEQLRILHYAKSHIETQIEVIEEKAEEAREDYQTGTASLLYSTIEDLKREREDLNKMIEELEWKENHKEEMK
nr:MAG TPA: hypothetical protein [Caudoviricetes sp.]